ncbi:N-acetylmuramic acid 6-phosphate etherase [Candidatus Poribacteria bacterium]|nr:N-acetylmuramic acid 6-phosphate etherase [Candidatus Poribacteria bacterium]
MSAESTPTLTEQHNPRSAGIDALSASDIVRLFAAEDRRAVEATVAIADDVARAVEWVAAALRAGGRLLYVGAGTSGRLGVLDASECPPTFGAEPSSVVGIIAGGDGALRTSAEGAEDDVDAGAGAMADHDVCHRDVVLGIAASGRTPYVLAALRKARGRSAKTVLLSCTPPRDDVAEYVDLFLTPLVGPEVISGSTRLKAGTATKLVLNQVSTGAMVLLGKVYGNRMVDVKPVNQKLRGRGVSLVSEIGRVDAAAAEGALDSADGDVKVAALALRRGLTYDEARATLAAANGSLRSALDQTPAGPHDA